MRTVTWALLVAISLVAAEATTAQQTASKPAAPAATAPKPAPPPATAPKPAVQRSSASAVNPVASVVQIMHAMVIPASNAVFEAAAEAPKSDQEWIAIQNSLVVLTESGNLLMLGRRAKDQTGWMTMSRAMVDMSAIALKAAEAKDGDALSEAGNKIYDTCENCHAKYMDQRQTK